jgi:hypothetical protein
VTDTNPSRQVAVTRPAAVRCEARTAAPAAVPLEPEGAERVGVALRGVRLGGVEVGGAVVLGDTDVPRSTLTSGTSVVPDVNGLPTSPAAPNPTPTAAAAKIAQTANNVKRFGTRPPCNCPPVWALPR